jgi:hypothetical protein
LRFSLLSLFEFEPLTAPTTPATTTSGAETKQVKLSSFTKPINKTDQF